MSSAAIHGRTPGYCPLQRGVRRNGLQLSDHGRAKLGGCDGCDGREVQDRGSGDRGFRRGLSAREDPGDSEGHRTRGEAETTVAGGGDGVLRGGAGIVRERRLPGSAAAAFGRPGASRGGSAYPQTRVVGFVENGTHVVFGAEMDRYDVGEITIARRILRLLRRNMLCLADRNFTNYPLWKQACTTGAALVWRAKTGIILPKLRKLS